MLSTQRATPGSFGVHRMYRDESHNHKSARRVPLGPKHKTHQHTPTHTNTHQHTTTHTNTHQHTHQHTPTHTPTHNNTQQHTTRHNNEQRTTNTHNNQQQPTPTNNNRHQPQNLSNPKPVHNLNSQAAHATKKPKHLLKRLAQTLSCVGAKPSTLSLLLGVRP